MRTQAVQCVRKRQKEFLCFLAKDENVSQEPTAPDQVEAWLEEAKATTWIGVALQALSTKLSTPITVWKRDGQRIKRYTLAPAFKNGYAKGSKNCRPIALVLESGHYKQLKPPNMDTEFLKQWLREGQTVTKDDLQGAGRKASTCGTQSLHTLARSEATPSVHTLVTRSKAQTGAPTPSVHTLHVSGEKNGGTKRKRGIEARVTPTRATQAGSMAGLSGRGSQARLY